MQQGLDYSERLDVPFVFCSNGDGFVMHDKTGTYPATEMNLSLDEFPERADMWRRYKIWRNIEDETESLVTSPNHSEIGGKTPRYYQQLAINRTIEAVAHGHDRLLLVMATGTGKTYELHYLAEEFHDPPGARNCQRSLVSPGLRGSPEVAICP